MYIETVPSPFTLSRPSLLKDFFIVLLGSVLLACAAPLSIKLPFTPVPLALAPHFCLLLGVTLGSKRAALAVLAYLAQGIAGLPVFALGASGFLHLLGPRGGYLLGCVLAAYVVGYLVENKKATSPSKLFLTLALGNGLIYATGLPQLAFFVGLKSSLWLGFVPFILGDLFKLLVIYKGARKLTHL